MSRRVDDGPRMNNDITAQKVRVVGDNVPNPGVFSLPEAIRMAEALGLDLVEITPNIDPPVCKIANFGKFQYSQSKQDRLNKAKQKRRKTK